MKKQTLLIFCILFVASICGAQQTAPISYDLSYRFTPGEKLHYRYFAKYDAIDEADDEGRRHVGGAGGKQFSSRWPFYTPVTCAQRPAKPRARHRLAPAR